MRRLVLAASLCLATGALAQSSTAAPAEVAPDAGASAPADLPDAGALEETEESESEPPRTDMIPQEENEPPPPKAWSLDLTIHDVGIGVGNSQHVDGLRLNFRDYSNAVVRGINITIWSPARHVRSDIAGLSIGLPATGGYDVRGIAVGGGIGMTLSLTAGGEDIKGLIVAPAYFTIVEDGDFRGVSLSAFNQIRGVQTGVAIGIFNYARELHGVQIGILNWAGNNPTGLKLLPIVNAHFG